MAIIQPLIVPRADLVTLNDIVPKFHLTNLSAGGAKVVDIIGDSTSTEVVAINYTMDPTQTIWGALQAELKRRNPDCTFTFNNRGIGGANWSHPMMTGTATGLTLPSWFTTPGNTWVSYVQNDAPDLLFVCLGTNAPSAGNGGTTSVATYMRQFFELVNAFTKKPNVILISNKVANPGAGGQYLTDQDSYRAMAGWTRTWARTNAKGYTTFSAVPYFGLLDIGRHYVARSEGYDPANQYFQSVPSAIRNSVPIGQSASPTTIGTTTAGDFRTTIVLPGAGGGALWPIAGNNGLYLQVSGWLANRIHFSLNNVGLWVTRYQTDGGDAAPAQAGSNTTPAAGDVTVTITCKQENIQVTINGVLVLNIVAPRFVAKHDVKIWFAATPTGSQNINITEFWEGIGSPTYRSITPQTAFGTPSGPQFGNGINHPSSSLETLDWAVIQAANLTAP